MSRSDDKPFDNKPCDAASLRGTSQAIPHDHFMSIVNENYGYYIKRAFGYLKCKSLAEDAVQDGILSAYKKLNTVRDVDALNGWINRIITNKALDILRKNKRMPDFYADIDDVVSYNRAGL
jgi:DNA-directed RNA polymerase specialized sigma24 family protein